MSDDKKNRDPISRTAEFGANIVRLCSELPRPGAGAVIGNQLVRCGTAVGAHYSESIRGRSDAEVVSKLETALQELEETDYWLDVVVRSETMPENRVAPLRVERNELTAMLVTCVKRVKARMPRK